MNWLLAIFLAIAVCGGATLWKRRPLKGETGLLITGILVPTEDPINDRFEIFIAREEHPEGPNFQSEPHPDELYLQQMPINPQYQRLIGKHPY